MQGKDFEFMQNTSRKRNMNIDKWKMIMTKKGKLSKKSRNKLNNSSLPRWLNKSHFYQPWSQKASSKIKTQFMPLVPNTWTTETSWIYVLLTNHLSNQISNGICKRLAMAKSFNFLQNKKVICTMKISLNTWGNKNVESSNQKKVKIKQWQT